MATTSAASDRFRVGTPGPSGSRLVTDRARSESFWVYPTLTMQQQLHGHERGSWYFRRLHEYSSRPQSIAYPSFESALAGLRFTQEFKDLDSEQAATTPRPS